MEHFDMESLKNLPDRERIQKINTFVWIGYSLANSILEEFKIMMDTPEKDRMPGRLLVGDVNNGKTVILKQFFKLNSPKIVSPSRELHIPVLFFRAFKSDEKLFYTSILNSIGISYTPQESKFLTLQRTVYLLKKVKVKFIIIDEFQNILSTGNMNQQRNFLVILKEFSNEMKVPIVLCGTKDAKYAINTDPNVRSRFDEIELKSWTRDEEYLRMLMSFEKILPLRKTSNLHHTDLSNKILKMSGGTLGFIKEIIDRAAILAIRNKTEKITIETLNQIRFNQNNQSL